MNKTRKPMAIALAILLTLTLSPAVALAQPLASGSIADAQDQPEKTLTTQAKAKYKTVYVVSKTNEVKKHGAKAKKTKINLTYTYNKNGLLTKVTRSSIPKYPITMTYKKNNMTSIRVREVFRNFTNPLEPSTSEYVKYKVISKNGRPVKQYDPTERAYWYYKYDKNGFLSGSYSPRRDPVSRIEYTVGQRSITFDTSKLNKYGDIDIAAEPEPVNGHPMLSYKVVYDKKGLIKSKTADYKALNKARAKLGQEQAIGRMHTVRWSYKKIKVPASYAKTVERQQWALRNQSISNGAFPKTGHTSLFCPI